MPAQREPMTAPALVAFAHELTAWREEAKLTKAELSRLLGYTPQWVGQIEECKNRPSRKFAEDCDTFFKTNGVFLRLWKNLNETRHQAALPPGFPEYLEREPKATSMWIFSGMLLHGLFQVEAVIQAIVSATHDQETAAELLDQRLKRQAAVFDRDDPPRIFLILDECLLRRVVGGLEVHRGQLQHLIDLTERHNINIQVVPLDSDYYPGLTGSLTIFGFEDGTRVAYTESAGTGLLIDDPVRIAELTVEYDLIQSHALPAGKTPDMIRTVLEEL